MRDHLPRADGYGRNRRYRQLDVTDWEALHEEQVGAKSKVWLASPDGGRWLFKQVRTEPGGLQRVLGEDWSERVACEVARELGLPTAETHLAVRQGQRGVISRNLVPDGAEFPHGNELLWERDPSYDQTKIGEVEGYTLDAVYEVLAPYKAPPGCPPAVETAGDAFAGCMVLDALISNQDRHHENWAVVVPAAGPGWLAPPYDQASCLGYQETAERKERLLAIPGGVLNWVTRGRGLRFQGVPRLIELAAEALRRCSSPAKSVWSDRVVSLSDDAWLSMLEAVPDGLGMSQVDRTFAQQVLTTNRRRLQDAFDY